MKNVSCTAEGNGYYRAVFAEGDVIVVCVDALRGGCLYAGSIIIRNIKTMHEVFINSTAGTASKWEALARYDAQDSKLAYLRSLAVKHGLLTE